MLLLIIFIFINVFKVTTVCGVKCTSVGDCACELSDGSGTIDLSPLKKFGNAPLYKNIPDSTNPGIKYDFDPCRQFACGTSGNTRVCGYVVSQTLKIGNDISFEYDEKAKIVSFVYSQVDQQINFKTSVQMHCEQAKTGKGEITDFTEGKQASNFYANLDSTYACPVPSTHNHPGELSTGTVLCIILLVIIFLYVVIGVIVNKYIRKLEGEEVFLNIKFWKDFPSLVKDGFVFTKNKVCKSKGEYEEI
ncbi:uncharacterized protein LOC130621806 [Hydractinia symbiolongicarpus]|uniref:uncharacterized protein LOC130621806 n=1 Tax=Hydractinia symbiolongicarpus TaxID=13093 RepID=UPI00254C38C0|nr:uncharacterized protein LOC130621806 [Hydractinia symbiolongicarpus]